MIAEHTSQLADEKRRGSHPKGSRAMTAAERKRAQRERDREKLRSAGEATDATLTGLLEDLARSVKLGHDSSAFCAMRELMARCVAVNHGPRVTQFVRDRMSIDPLWSVDSEMQDYLRKNP